MILMHKNTPAAEVVTENGMPVRYARVFDEKELPLGSYNENPLTCQILFKKWVEGRMIPAARPGLTRLEERLGLNEASMFMQTAGISINDTYWFCENPREEYWEDVNYHDNGFDEVALSVLLDRIAKGMHSPDFTTDGVMDKFWFISHNRPFLAKIDTVKDGVLIANEVLYSNIAASLDIYTTPYFEGKLVNLQYCACPGFVTTPDVDFVTAMQLKHEDMRRTGPVLLEYLSSKLGFEKEVRQMIALDCLFHNTDRHEKNFGIIVDGNGNAVFAPLYDNGYCLGVSHDDMIVTDADMKLFPDSRADLLNKYGMNLDINSQFVLSELKRVYELFSVPEWRYEKAKMELEYGMSLFCKRSILFPQIENTQESEWLKE